MRDALSIFDRVVSFSGNKLTRQAVAENLNVLDYDSYFKTTDLLLDNNIPQVLIHFNEILGKGFDGHHFISGLASHFRDLLVAKDKATIDLLEVGDTAKKQYLEQAIKAPMSFLISAIDMANDCDLKYRTSKNQRLLVELTLMQLASITFSPAESSEKKKSKNFIIPSINFIGLPSKSTPEKSHSKPTEKESTTAPLKKLIGEKISPQTINEKVTKPIIKTERRRSSALSLNSIHKKPTVQKSIIETTENQQDLPKQPFTESQFLELWDAYILKLNSNGEKIIASIMNANKPKVLLGSIEIVFPNTMMEAEFLKMKPKLLRYFREKLTNYSIDFKTIVNEENEKKFAYTPQEKYNKLLEKNKALAKLKNTFKLDL